MNRERSVELCRLIAGLVVSDDDLDATEEAFLDRLLEKFGIPATERDSLFPIVHREQAADAVGRLPPDVQRDALELLVQATVADGRVAPEERAYLDAVAAQMKVTPAELEARIAATLAQRP